MPSFIKTKGIPTLPVVLLAVWTCLTSCEKPSDQYEQGFQELSLDTELASITVIDSLCFVGGENGDLYVLKDGKVCQHLQSDEPRIYRIYYGDADTCCLGIRNKGVARCLKPRLDSIEGQLELVDSAYKQIPRVDGNDKGNKYSPYGFIRYNDSIVLATTSNGLFFFNPVGRQDTLDVIKSPSRAGEPYVYCSPVSDGSSIFIATKEGVLRIDKNGGKPSISSTLLKGRQITKLQVKGDTLYALAKYSDHDSLHVWDIHSNIMADSIRLDFTAFDMVWAKGKLYFVNASSLFVATEERKGRRLQVVKVIPLPHRVLSDTRNNMVYDTAFQKIRIVTNRSVVSFPAVNFIGESDIITQSCIDGKTDKLYLLNTKNELFLYRSGMEAEKIIQFPEDEEISGLSAHDGVFYYIKNHGTLKKVSNKGLYRLINDRVSFSSTCCKLQNESTAMLSSGDTAYVGVRDLLQLIDLKTCKDTRVEENVKPYITRFRKVGGDIYAITLNDGLINVTKRDTTFRERQFLNDFLLTKSGDTLLLDNHHVYLLTRGHRKHSMRADGFNRLFLDHSSDSGAVISKRKIQFFSVRNDSLVSGLAYDYYLNPEACSIIKDTLFLATDWGMIKMNVNKPSLEEAEGVIIPKTETDWFRIIICLTLVAVCGYALVPLLWRTIRNLKKTVSKLEDEESKLVNQLKETEKSLKDTQESLTSAIGQKQEVDAQIVKLKEEKGNIENELKEAKESLKNAQEQLNSTLNEKVKAEGQVEGLERRVEELERRRKEIEAQLEDSVRERKEYFNYRIGRLCEATDYITDENLKEEICTLKERIDAETIDDDVNSRLQAATERVAVRLVKRIEEQIDKLEKIKGVSCQKHIEASKDAIDENKETKDTEHLLKIVRENEKFLEWVKETLDTLDSYEAFASQTIVIAGVTDMLSEEIENVKTALLQGKGQKPFNSLKKRMSRLNTADNIKAVREHIGQSMAFKDNSENKLSAGYLNGQLVELSALLGKRDISNDEVRSLLIRMKKLQRYVDLMRPLEKIRTADDGLNKARKHIDAFFDILAKDDKDTELVEKATSREVKPKSVSKSCDLFAAIMAHPRENRKYQAYTKHIYRKIREDNTVNSNSGNYKSPMSRLQKYSKYFDAKSAAAQGLQGYDEFLLLLMQDFQSKLRK